jgi:hypothetical protein
VLVLFVPIEEMPDKGGKCHDELAALGELFKGERERERDECGRKPVEHESIE